MTTARAYADAATEQAAANEEAPPEAPRPLFREMSPADPFPVDALGSVLSAACAAIVDKVQCPAAIAAQSVLAAAGLAVQAHADIRLPMGHAVPISDLFISVAATGERKSGSDREALWPIIKMEQNLRAEYDAKYPLWQNEFAAWSKQKEQILSDRKKYQTKEAKAEALNWLGAAPVAPLTPLLVCPDPNFEGLVRLFQEGRPSIGLFSAEGGQFVGGHGMTDDNKLKTATNLSGLWDGSPIKRVRGGSGVIILNGRRLSLHLMMQPDVAATMLSDRVLLDQGLLSRVLVCAPPSAAGIRLWHDPAPESDHALRRYGARLLSILEAPLPLAEGKVNELAPRVLDLSPAARATWIKFSDHIEKQIAPGGALESVRGLANKLAEHAARLASTLALVENLSADAVGCLEMDAGIALAEHYASEALRLFEASSVSTDLTTAQRLLAWLLTTWTEPAVSLPDIYQKGPRAIRDKTAAAKMVEILESHGWLTKARKPVTVAGQIRRDAWFINRGQA